MSATPSKRLIASFLCLAMLLLTACKDSGTTQTQSTAMASSDRDALDSGQKAGSLMASVTLRWTPPGKRTDGSKLYPSDIEGYRIRYRLKTNDRFQSVTVNNGSTTEHTLTLDAGVYVFTIATIDAHRQESQPSQPVTASVI